MINDMLDQSSEITPRMVGSVFSKAIGELVWQVQLGHGSFITMEFGNPSLIVREPILKKEYKSQTSMRVLQSRKVSVVGSQHLWVQYAQWSLIGVRGIVDSSCNNKRKMETAIGQIDGQKLIEVSYDKFTSKIALKFDLGAELAISSDREFPDSTVATMFSAKSYCEIYHTLNGNLLLKSGSR